MCIKCWNRSLTLTQSVALAALSVWFSFGGQSEVPSSVACPSIFLLDYQPTATFSLEPALRRQPVLLGDAWHRCRPSEVYKYTLCCVCQQGTKVSPSASTSFVFFFFVFFALLSSSSACRSIDKHSWLRNLAMWNAPDLLDRTHIAGIAGGQH